MCKKIMVMSSSLDARLLYAVEEARKSGMKSVAIVREEDDPRTAGADRAYAVDAGDIDTLLKIAGKEEIDGILGLWDKTVLPAAIIAEKLGLKGNSPESLRSLLEKSRFRRLQDKAGVFHPGFLEADTGNDLEERCGDLRFPLIIKPVQSSSSCGQTVIYDRKDLFAAFCKAQMESADGRVCVEEYIRHDSPNVLEADIFLMGEDILWDGISWSVRFPEVPIRPVLNLYPADLSREQMAEFQSAVRKLLMTANVRFGEYNIEGFFTEEGRFFVIEINPRPAGYLMHREIVEYCGVNYSRLLVSAAVGDLSYYNELRSYERQRNYVLSYAIFSQRAGIYDHIHIDSSVRRALVTLRYTEVGVPGTYIEDIHTQNRPCGIAIFRLSSEEELIKLRDNLRDLVYVVVRD